MTLNLFLLELGKRIAIGEALGREKIEQSKYDDGREEEELHISSLKHYVGWLRGCGVFPYSYFGNLGIECVYHLFFDAD